MNWQMIVSWIAKAALAVAPIAIAKGLMTQEQVDSILAALDAVPGWVQAGAALVTSILGVYSLIRTAFTHKK